MAAMVGTARMGMRPLLAAMAAWAVLVASELMEESAALVAMEETAAR